MTDRYSFRRREDLHYCKTNLIDEVHHSFRRDGSIHQDTRRDPGKTLPKYCQKVRLKIKSTAVYATFELTDIPAACKNERDLSNRNEILPPDLIEGQDYL